MSHVILAGFHRQLVDMDHTRKRMESLYRCGHITLRDIASVYEALFLRAVTFYEKYCETLFFSILEGRTCYSAKKVERNIKQASPRMFRVLVFQGQKYLDWLPFEKTEKRVALYLCRRGPDRDCGRPFMDLANNEKTTLQTIMTIRHAIAHSSEHAIRKFKQIVIGNQALLSREKTPAGFLRSQVSNAPVQTRFEVYLADLGGIATRLLCSPIKRPI